MRTEQREWIALGETEDWSAYVKRRLREVGKAQEDLAIAIGVRLGTLNRWLTGTHGAPGPGHLRAIARALAEWDRALPRKRRAVTERNAPRLVPAYTASPSGPSPGRGARELVSASLHVA